MRTLAARRIGVSALLLAAWASIAPLPAGAAPADSAPVAIADGRVRGVVEDGVVSFKGVPFAAPPVGELRWAPPQPVRPWSGVRAADAFGRDCWQTPFDGDQAPSRAGFSEDCLYLNVWAPADAAPGGDLPVMVWIHGGGFTNGGSSPAVFDGSAFARDGVILVSANYRLGRFGFFAHPALSDESPDGPRGNYALMDMIAALEWTRRNIAAFGGDPERVTIFGGSTGGWAVQALTLSPAADGLFAQAIAQSPFAYDRMPPVSAPQGAPSGEAIGLEIAASLGVTDPGAEGLAALRALPAEIVSGGLNMLNMGQVRNIGPMVDGVTVSGPPQQLFAEGRGAPVPFLIGANNADALFSLGSDLDSVYAPVGARRDEAEALYDPDGEGRARVIGAKMASDAGMNLPVRGAARALAAQERDVFVYRFSYVADALQAQDWGAAHGREGPYVFDTLRAAYGDGVAEADARMADDVHAYWVAFARTGVMAPDGLPPLPAYDPDAPEILVFGPDGPDVGADPLADRLDFIESVLNAN